MQRVFLIHGWTGENSKDWFPWAKEELEKRSFEVYAPEMPEPVYPRIEPWVAVFSDDDPVVSYDENYRIFEENLGAKVILEKGMGHFNQESGVVTLPILLELVK